MLRRQGRRPFQPSDDMSDNEINAPRIDNQRWPGFWLRLAVLLSLLTAVAFLATAGRASLERFFLFFPTRRPHNNDLTPWRKGEEIIGYARLVESPQNVWLMLHGNAGQASHRLYAMPCFAAEDAIFVMEYPGYGQRSGVPSKESFNQAAAEAYYHLRETYPQTPVGVVAESLGSGPAASLATSPTPPDKLVFIVPFARLVDVAADHFPAFLVRWVLQSDWDNGAALAHYQGPVDVFGAKEDRVIPVHHARALAEAVPGANLVVFEGGHNDWAAGCRVEIRYP
jgi:uncharacterized protein